MNVVDSSAWLEYFADEPNAEFFAPAIEDTPNLIVPVICLYEVFKRVFQQRGEDAALEAVALMMQGQVVAGDASLAGCGSRRHRSGHSAAAVPADAARCASRLYCHLRSHSTIYRTGHRAAEDRYGCARHCN